MIPWVDEQCRAWGAHRRWMLVAQDGWPEKSILGRLIEEGPGAGHESHGSRMPYREPPEAYTLVSVALQRMAATHELGKSVDVLKAHYLLDGKAKQKAPWLGLSTAQYWAMLHSGHAAIAVLMPDNVTMRVNGRAA